MKPLYNLHLRALFIITLGLTSGLIGPKAAKADWDRFEISLYTGITEIVKLGQTQKAITDNSKYKFTNLEIAKNEEIKKSGIVSGIDFESKGITIFFKATGSTLIVLKPPFHGKIKGKNLQIFDTEKPSEMSWEDFVIKTFGQPEAKRNGGRIVGDVFYYAWGDVQFGPTGLRKLMLYRDKAIRNYREATQLEPTNILD
jgi:hypothetical protein